MENARRTQVSRWLAYAVVALFAAGCGGGSPDDQSNAMSGASDGSSLVAPPTSAAPGMQQGGSTETGGLRRGEAGSADEASPRAASAGQRATGEHALSLGLSATFADDHGMLKHGMVMYDALYAWCKLCQAETHNWPPAMQ